MMIKNIRTALGIVVCTSFMGQLHAQSQIPYVRQTFHDKIDISQKRLDKLVTLPDDKNAIDVNNALVDSVQDAIEKDKTLDDNGKLKYLRGIGDLLETYMVSFKAKSVTYFAYPSLIRAYAYAMDLTKNDKSIVPVVNEYDYRVGELIINNYAFKDNRGVDASKQLILTKSIAEHPGDEMKILDKHPEYEKSDSVIKEVAKRDPDIIYTYVRANSPLSDKIKKSPDLLLHTIVELAPRQNGRQYFPFLDNLYRGKTSLDEIDEKSKTPVDYYKLLVATEIDYASRVINRDTPMAMDALFAKLKITARDAFINEINGLHENPNPKIRFKALEPLNTQELYYLAIAGEEELYTSSYLNGVYPQIFEKGGAGFTGDDLMTSVYFDHFKKWIKIAANYNTLDNFLKRMTGNNGAILMKEFARNLDKNIGKDSLEDAVDVAGSYGSIQTEGVKQIVLNEVQRNLEEAKSENNQKKKDIYNILNTLFLSSNQDNKIDVSEALGIEPVYFMPISKLKNSKGRIIIQQFFYGDVDGRNNYANFMSKFGNAAGWKTTSNAEWAVTSTTSGTPISIYSNKPLDENQGLDDKAQQDMNAYLAENDLQPTVVIHRGHSYYLGSTIKQLAATSKVVMLGSCGAFQNLNDVLKISPEAQIISSRQTGTGIVNMSVISGMLSYLKEGKELNWVKMWQDFKKELHGNAEFQDYVPPYENLGAVFIMAYKRQQEKHQND